MHCGVQWRSLRSARQSDSLLQRCGSTSIIFKLKEFPNQSEVHLVFAGSSLIKKADQRLPTSPRITGHTLGAFCSPFGLRSAGRRADAAAQERRAREARVRVQSPGFNLKLLANSSDVPAIRTNKGIRLIKFIQVVGSRNLKRFRHSTCMRPVQLVQLVGPCADLQADCRRFPALSDRQTPRLETVQRIRKL